MCNYFSKYLILFVLFVFFQDGLDALVYDLDFPALRKNKNIDNFLNRCKYLMFNLLKNSSLKYQKENACTSSLKGTWGFGVH